MLNVDFLRPLPNGNMYLPLCINDLDFHFLLIPPVLQQRILSKYFMSYLVSMVTLEKSLATMGHRLSQKEIKDYFSKHAIIHHRITPYWPQANGEIERFMQPMMKIIQSACIEQNYWESAFQEFLFSYRVTPHSSTQIPPADLMYSRRIRYTLPDISNEINSKTTQSTLQRNDSLAKQTWLDYTAGKR